MAAKPKITREAARDSLPEHRRKDFDALVESVAKWSEYFYGTKLISYAILAELIKDGWSKQANT
jgi:hypothetical protein